MEKQYTKSIKDYLVKTVAEEMGMAEEVVDRVVMWSFKDLRNAMDKCSSVEISGFGSLILNQNKLRKQIDEMEKTAERLKAAPDRYNYNGPKWAEESLVFLKSRIKNELETDSGGVAQSDDSEEGNESSDRRGEQTASGEMPELPI